MSSSLSFQEATGQDISSRLAEREWKDAPSLLLNRFINQIEGDCQDKIKRAWQKLMTDSTEPEDWLTTDATT
jgi:hypothetical protein